MAYTEDVNEYSRLEELGGSGYEIADGQPNIKGWDVRDASGREIGEVDELLFNPHSRKVRYIVLDLDKNDFNLESKKVLVPIGVAQLHEREDDVVISGLSEWKLRALPEYDKDNFNPAFESRVRNIFASNDEAAYSAIPAGDYETHPADFYEHEVFDEDRFYHPRDRQTAQATGDSIPVIEENIEVGKREVEKGGTRLVSRVVERPVEENITLREEHVHVERTPVNRPVEAGDLQNFQEGEIEMTERKEVPVVNKEARVVEEVRLNKTETEENYTVEDTVRRTEVEEERIQGDRDVLNRDRDI